MRCRYGATHPYYTQCICDVRLGGFRRGVNDMISLLGCYVRQIGHPLSKFREIRWIPLQEPSFPKKNICFAVKEVVPKRR
jgi:hypothetical protein